MMGFRNLSLRFLKRYVFGLVSVFLLLLIVFGANAQDVFKNINGREFHVKDGKLHRYSKGKSYPVILDRISVRFVKGTVEADIKQLRQQLGTEVIRRNRLGFYDLALPDGADPLRMVEAFYDSGLVEFAEVNIYGEFTDVNPEDYSAEGIAPTPDEDAPEIWETWNAQLPNDTSFGLQWFLDHTAVHPGTADADIDAPEAWVMSVGTDVVVAILDSGVDIDHVDLQANLWKNIGETPGNGIDDDSNGYIDDYDGWDFHNNDNDPRGPFWHGTHVAGIVGAVTNNGTGVSGVAGGWGPGRLGASLMPLGVGDMAPDSSVIDDAFIYATDMGARIIQLSLSVFETQAIRDAIDYAYANDVVIVCAAGNTPGGGPVDFPANYADRVIAVAATDHNDDRSTYSNFGAEIDVAAPGGDGGSPDDRDIYSTLPGNAYGYSAGTSMAAPVVSAIAALIASIDPSVTNAEIEDIIERTAEDRGDPGWDQYYGWGRVNAHAAVAATKEVIARALEWLRLRQLGDGSWPVYSSIRVGSASLIALAFLNHGYTEDEDTPSNTVSRAIQYILSKVEADGSIRSYPGGYYSVYETSLAIMALCATRNDTYNTIILDAAQWLADQQWTTVPTSDWQYGGFGYTTFVRPDLSNTQYAIMALETAEDCIGMPDAWSTDLITFLTRCQRGDGGSQYTPFGSLSELGSYGSMTAANIWSMRLAGLNVNDSRVSDSLDWLSLYENMDFDDNPRMSPDGRRFQYYYYMTVAKALTMCGLEMIGGINWYDRLSAQIESLQYPSGYWQNSYTGHGSENYPEIATAFSILALQTRALAPGEDLWVSIILASHADLHVYDPGGRHTGLDYATGQIETQIPGSTFEIDALGRQIINLRQLQTGAYRIELVGTSDGSYELTIEGYAANEQTSSDIFEGEITAGEAHVSDTVITSTVGVLTIYVDEPKKVPSGLVAIAGDTVVDLSWNTIADADLLGYKVYYGTASRDYGEPIDVGNSTNYRLTGLTNGVRYYAAVTACYADGSESGYSIEVSAIPLLVVEIDIKPGSYPNSINLGSDGVIPVAILTTSIAAGDSVDFDAANVDQFSLTLASSAAREKGKSGNIGSFEDVDGDGDLDLVVQFPTVDLALTENDSEAVLEGQTLDGTPIEGCDSINVVPPAAAPAKPAQFALLQNYPSIFNPDTWIPYQLAGDVDVVIRIYDTAGRLVRMLDLGHKPAGFYTTRGKAAYWDGRNETGEEVASGVYFYTIQAGKFTATKKMVIAK